MFLYVAFFSNILPLFVFPLFCICVSEHLILSEFSKIKADDIFSGADKTS